VASFGRTTISNVHPSARAGFSNPGHSQPRARQWLESCWPLQWPYFVLNLTRNRPVQGEKKHPNLPHFQRSFNPNNVSLGLRQEPPLSPSLLGALSHDKLALCGDYDLVVWASPPHSDAKERYPARPENTFMSTKMPGLPTVVEYEDYVGTHEVTLCGPRSDGSGYKWS
jgi:hypothetical protein